MRRKEWKDKKRIMKWRVWKKEAVAFLRWHTLLELVTNFIRPYLHQFFDDSHGLKAGLKPLERPFDRY